MTTNFCTASNQIGTYANSASGTILFAKNIDCVTLEADLVSAGAITVDGVDLSDYTDIVEKTQNISASLAQTTFAGNVTSPGLEVSQVQALDPVLGVQVGSTINQEIATTSSGIQFNMTNPSLGTNNTMGMVIGTSKTLSTTGWQMLYVNTNSAGSQSNRLDFRMLGYTNPTLALTQGKVGINTQSATEALDVSGNAKISGTLAVTGLFTPTLPIVSVAPTILSANS